MTREGKIKVTIEYVWESEVVCGEIKRKKYFVSLDNGEHLRDIALRLANDTKELSPLLNDSAIIFRLKNDGTEVGKDFGIKYGINQNGSLRRLKWYESTQYDWSYGELLKLKELGIIDGDIEYIIAEIPEGLGAAGGSGLEQLNDLANYINTIETVIRGGSGFVRFLKIKNSVKRIRENGFNNPRDIREVIERRDSWTLKKIKKLFQMDTISVIAILVNLGYVENGDHWFYDEHDADSLKMRAKWLESEKQYDEKIKKM